MQSSSTLQVTRTGIKSWMGSNSGRIWPVTLELRALERWKKNDVSSFSQAAFVRYLSNLQVTRTGIKSRRSSNLGRVGLFSLQSYLPLSVPIDFEWGKWCLHLFSVTMNWVFIKLTGNEDRHKISDEFEFRSYLTRHFGVTCPWTVKKKKMSSAFLSHLKLDLCQTCTTGIKARMSSKLGRIGLFTFELFALERAIFSKNQLLKHFHHFGIILWSATTDTGFPLWETKEAKTMQIPKPDI